MDTKNLIDYLTIVSNENLYLNFGMHLLVIASLISVFLLKSSTIRQYILEGTMLVLFLSVTINAVIFGNPFHVITFGIMSVTAGYLLCNREKTKVASEFQPNFRIVIAILLIVLGLWYPELANVNAMESFLFSPVGVIPCPTLITVLGLTNLFSPYINRKLFFVIIFFGILYGFIGSFKLGVYFDIVLICAAMFSLFHVIANKRVKEILS